MGARLTDRPSDYTYAKRKVRWPWLISGIVVALGIIAVGSYLAFGQSKTGQPSATANTTAKIPRALDGVLVDPAQANLQPVAVIIENHSSVRPQSGLSQASVVYEALAEGGITRFLAVFALAGTAPVGPVRSARPYLVDLAREYGGLFVHAGYSPQGQEEITKTGIANLDQFFKPDYFHRVDGRPAEHALFTNLDQLGKAVIDAHLPANGHEASWPFGDDHPVGTAPQNPITIDFSTASYRVTYTYATATNAYVRTQGGTPSTDVDGTPIAPKNIAVMLTTSTLFDTLRRNITVTGNGKLLFFHDGTVVTGTWSKADAASRIRWLDQAGKPIQLNRGQTWVEVVDVPEKNVSY